MDLTFCIVNTNGGDLLADCLRAIDQTDLGGIEHETLVLDNASDDGSPEVARDHAGVKLIELSTRQGKAASDSQLMRAAHGEFCLLLNEDTELLPAAPKILLNALRADSAAACAGAQLLNSDGVAQPSAWRFTGVATSLASALWLHRFFVVQSDAIETRRVDWAQSAALMVRREAAFQVNFLDPAFFVYGDEVDFCKRLADAGRHTLYVPSAQAFHREGLSTGASAARRILQFHRGRDLYMKKHHGMLARYLVRWLTAFAYATRALFATVLPGHDARRYLTHVRAALRPWSGIGMSEAAAAYNESRQT